MNKMDRSFRALKASYASGDITKADFLAQAHSKFHSLLFEYASELSCTDIARIEIVDGSVVMTSRADGISTLVDCLDHRTAPIETLNFNQYEPEESSVIRRIAPQIDTMLDVGANIGWYSIMVASINASAAIHAFEPIPKTFSRLLVNCDLNNARSIYCHNYGLSSEPGKFPFYFYPEGSGNASIKNLANNDDAQLLFCELRTLSQVQDDILRTARVDFIKCDVEGNEIFVLQGGLSVLQKHKPILLVELLRKWCAPFGYHPNDVFILLAELGYSAYTVSSHGFLSRVESITDDTAETNFFFVHPESRLLSLLDI